MHSTPFLTSLALLASAISMPLIAGGSEQPNDRPPVKKQAQQRPAAYGFDYRIQPVPNPADANTPAYGWRYFTDPAVPRAVVISPQGDYYYSRGKGLHWIAAEQY